MATDGFNQPSSSTWQSGYLRMADFMAKFLRAAHLRTFAATRLEMLLHDQEEIIALIDEYQELQMNDCRSDDVRRAKYTRNYITALEDDAPGEDKTPVETLRLERRIREKLQSYCKTTPQLTT